MLLIDCCFGGADSSINSDVLLLPEWLKSPPITGVWICHKLVRQISPFIQFYQPERVTIFTWHMSLRKHIAQRPAMMKLGDSSKHSVAGQCNKKLFSSEINMHDYLLWIIKGVKDSPPPLTKIVDEVPINIVCWQEWYGYGFFQHWRI